MLHPSPRFWRLRLSQLGLGGGLLALVGLTVGATSGVTGAVAGGLVAAAATGVAGLSLRRRVLSWGYEERGEDLVVTRGVLVRRTTVVPYGRMQFLDVTAGPFERSFGLATVQLHTAAAASDARIPGLAAVEAARLRDRLAELGEARAQGL